eukprot:2861641-Rhodomonas_salina.1
MNSAVEGDFRTLRVHDPTNVGILREHAAHMFQVPDVYAFNHRTHRALPVVWKRTLRCRQEHNMIHALLYQRLRAKPPEVTQTSYEICGLPEGCWVLAQDHLADMLRLLHEVECCPGLLHREAADGQERNATGQSCDQEPLILAGVCFRHVIQSNQMIADIWPQGCDLFCRPDVALSNFAEVAPVYEHSEGELNEFTRQA